MSSPQQQFTEKARDAIITGQQITEQRKLAQFEPEALLHALIGQQDGVVPQILQRLSVDPQTLLRELWAIRLASLRARGASAI